jgi:hypothetical protein
MHVYPVEGDDIGGPNVIPTMNIPAMEFGKGYTNETEMTIRAPSV